MWKHTLICLTYGPFVAYIPAVGQVTLMSELSKMTEVSLILNSLHFILSI